ncbi:hypothetical protein SESBI_32380 [Sesbania bispinosa]|nr:hypothetical protein SESBI_32380 [Sesbania bispinosa]
MCKVTEKSGELMKGERLKKVPEACREALCQNGATANGAGANNETTSGAVANGAAATTIDHQQRASHGERRDNFHRARQERSNIEHDHQQQPSRGERRDSFQGGASGDDVPAESGDMMFQQREGKRFSGKESWEFQFQFTLQKRYRARSFGVFFLITFYPRF